MAIWLVRPGNAGQVQEIAYVEGNKNGYALIGWGDLDDLSNAGTVEEIRNQVQDKYPNKAESVLTRDANEIYRFLNTINLNDICVLPLQNPSRYVLGYFVSQYEHFPDNNEYGRHGRAVNWVTEPIQRDEIPETLRRHFDRRQTVYQIAEEGVDQWINQQLQDYGVTMNEVVQTVDSEEEEFDVLFRKRVEAAIDECDELGESDFLRKHGRGVSRGYWVLSTRPNRKLDKYASKAMAVIASQKYIQGGGWYDFNNACSVLHNGGYIIVNQNGEPVTEIDTPNGIFIIPNGLDFLLQGEKRIRAVAINYYIEPARETNQSTVNINVDKLHDMIGLSNQHDEVVNALRLLDSVATGIDLEEEIVNEQNITEEFVFRIALPVPYTIDNIIEDGCFIEKEEIEIVLNRLETKKNMILQGPPGTGKTWLAKRLGYALVGFEDTSKVLSKQFHPNLSYEDFIRGWRPKGEGKLSLVDGTLLEMIKMAKSDPDSNYVLVIEEINRGNPAQIFGEMLTLLETDKRNEESAMELTYKREEGERIYVPENLHIIGTMNLADRSLALVDLALRRRFAFIDLAPVFGTKWQNWVHDKNGIDPEFLRMVESRLHELNDQIESDPSLGAQFKIGHSYVTPATDATIEDSGEWLREIVETEIGPLLEEYWFDEPQKASDAKQRLLNGI